MSKITNSTISSTKDEGIILETPPADLRPEIVSLARELERLPSGTYSVLIDKPNLKGLPWRMEIDKTEKIRIMDLKR